MSVILATGTADAPYKLLQHDVKQFIYNLFSESGVEMDRMISIFDNSTVTNRHFTVPVDWLGRDHALAERNHVFIDTALSMSEKAILNCLMKVNAFPEDIDHIIFVTSTGLATPTIDALLLNRIKFNRHIKRTPIWGLGCAAGAAGLSRAMEYTRAYPESNALLVAVELCSLTFQKDDLSKSNIIATSLFSDGAAAVLVAGKENKLYSGKGLDMADALSTTYYDSTDVMGWKIIDTGFKVLFSRDIPSIVREYFYPNVQELLDVHKLTITDIKHFITHPGGKKVIDAIESSLVLTNGALNYARKVLKEHGNMSSPSVLYVLDEFLNSSDYPGSEYGIITALGPGFSSEIILFKTL